LGKTTHLTITPAPYVTAKEIASELKEFFSKGHPPVDFITLGGSGEPTLNKHIGEVIKVVKELNKAPVAVLTNGSLLWKEDIAKAMIEADVVMPSLDSGVEETWQRLNRPHPKLRLKNIVEGLKEFRQIYLGKIWLEILFVKGLNDSEHEVSVLKSILKEISPNKIHLNTVVRPPAEKGIWALSFEELKKIKNILGEKAEIVADFKKRNVTLLTDDLEEKLIALLRRRPCTLEDIACVLGISLAMAHKTVEVFLNKKRIDTYLHQGQKYYLIR